MRKLYLFIVGALLAVLSSSCKSKLNPNEILIGEFGSLTGPQATFVDLSAATWRDGVAPVLPRSRGTLPYAAPEIVRAERPADRAADVYALGAVLLGLAVGALTRATTEAGRLVEVGTRGVDASRLLGRTDLPERARRAVARAVAFDRGERLHGARELSSELCSSQ